MRDEHLVWYNHAKRRLSDEGRAPRVVVTMQNADEHTVLILYYVLFLFSIFFLVVVIPLVISSMCQFFDSFSILGSWVIA
jgi:hypothetical protein